MVTCVDVVNAASPPMVGAATPVVMLPVPLPEPLPLPSPLPVPEPEPLPPFSYPIFRPYFAEK
jgi:hypothetical protein